jgi:hypothetical protein
MAFVGYFACNVKVSLYRFLGDKLLVCKFLIPFDIMHLIIETCNFYLQVILSDIPTWTTYLPPPRVRLAGWSPALLYDALIVLAVLYKSCVLSSLLKTRGFKQRSAALRLALNTYPGLTLHKTFLVYRYVANISRSGTFPGRWLKIKVP